MASNVENILQATIDGTTYDVPANSRVEELLIELKAVIEAGGGGGGFTPTDTQLDAMNSGIDSTKVEQIQTNKDAIDDQQNTTDSGGNGYALINGIRLYVASSAPTGNIPDGSVGVGW